MIFLYSQYMERRMLIWKEDVRYSGVQRELVVWAQKKMAFFVESILVKQETSDNPEIRNLHGALWPRVRFGDLQVKFPQHIPTYPTMRVGLDPNATRLAGYVEFAYTEQFPHLPEQIFPLRPAVIVKKLPPYTEQTIDVPKPGEFVIDQIPSPAREALEMAVGMAGMHYLAVHFAHQKNLTYFHEHITMASRLKDVATYVGAALGISEELAVKSLGVDAEVSFGLSDLRHFLELPDIPPVLTKGGADLQALKDTAAYLLQHPMDFIFVRANVTPQIAAQQLHLRNVPMSELIAVFLQRSGIVLFDQMNK